MSRSGVGALAVLLAAILWGTTGTAASFAPSVSPLAIGAAAMGVGGILQALVAVRPIALARGELRDHLALVLLGAVSVAVYPLAFYSSMRLGGVAIGTVVSIASAPIASAVLERVVDGIPLTRRWAIAAALAISGSAILCLSRLGADSAAGAATLASVALGLLAGITYALYSWVVQRLMARGVPRAAAMGTVFGIGGLVLIPVLLLTGAPILDSALTFGVAVYMALVPMFLGYILFGIGLARVRASTATTITLAEPAVAAVLAVAILGERLGPLGWTGLVMIACGLAVLTVPVRSRPGKTVLVGVDQDAARVV